MPLRRLPVLMVLLLVGCARTPPSPPMTAARLTVSEIQKHPPIGGLGVPLGTCVEVRATIVHGDDKATSDKYLLKVTHVDGAALAEPRVMEFRVPDVVSGVKLPRDWFELYEMKTGRRAGSVGSAEIQEMEKGYLLKLSGRQAASR